MSHRLIKCNVRRGLATLAFLSLAATCSAVPVGGFREKMRDDAWIKSDEGKRILENTLTWQNPNGGWWKNYDLTEPAGKGKTDGKAGDSTIDNLATSTEMRLLARGHVVTGDQRYADAFNRGLHFLVDMQYPNGGWPQRKPIAPTHYAAHITYNDNAMFNVMMLLRDIRDGKPEFDFVTPSDRAKASEAFDKGITCILDTQVKKGDRLTVWCAQHDEKTLAPAAARAYELVSLSGGDESASLVMLLMDIENPTDREKAAIIGASRWFEQHKVTGIRLEDRKDANGKSDKVIVQDAGAKPLWGRFYDVDTEKVFFCGRDGQKLDDFEGMEQERQVGYAWLRPWGQKVLDRYPKWAQQHGVTETLDGK